MKNCSICNSEFKPRTYNNNVCSTECKRLYNNRLQLKLHYQRMAKKAPMKKNCLICEAEFTLKRKGHLAKTCSPQCLSQYRKEESMKRTKANSKRKIIPCKMCGTEFLPFNNRRFCCSHECSERYQIQWKKTNKEFRIKKMLRGFIQRIFKGMTPTKSWKDVVSYDVKQFREHIEKQFSPGMSWDKYGKKGFHIDHIKPLAAFNFFTKNGDINIAEVRAAMSLDNLQPLWAIENLRKAAKLKLIKNGR